MDRKVGQVFRQLPAILLELEDDYEHQPQSKKRKVRSGALSEYEPKSKVMVSTKDNKFQVSVDTSNYQPDEISVKIVNDKIAISAKHESKGNDVYEYHEMYRCFDLPSGVEPSAVTSRLSASGQLTVEAPLKTKESLVERTVPVEIQNKEQQTVDITKTPTKDQSSETK
ncbi:heat shock protein beta-6-like [Stegodyphus dumicola]|uniref:heat shock protein beta-6-like n=1 Tax=Stegodyphus dumicola TaxID=202533 RepID=UPI0015B0A968|nr:heat shock protein beta-6-like [Stegodyphus dumicola]